LVVALRENGGELFREHGFVDNAVCENESPFIVVQRGHKLGLVSETVQGPSLTLECVDDVHGDDRLAPAVLGIGDGVADDALEEDLEDVAGLFVDEP
jgi:hypothetical protein